MIYVSQCFTKPQPHLSHLSPVVVWQAPRSGGSPLPSARSCWRQSRRGSLSQALHHELTLLSREEQRLDFEATLYTSIVAGPMTSCGADGYEPMKQAGMRHEPCHAAAF